jgi:D-alanine transaminase
MSRIAYVDGRFTRFSEAQVHVEDRGLQFGDAVYEVWAVRDGKLLDAAGHLARLARSLAALRIEPPMADAALSNVVKTLVRRNRVRDGLVYLQVTRGVARRDHPFPALVHPTVILTARPMDRAAAEAKAAKGVRVMSVPDGRWSRVDIKTTNLLPNVLAKQAALEAGFDDAWLVDARGMVTEGTAQNAWIVDAAGVLVTRDLTHAILPGITRSSVARVAHELGMRVEERAFSLAEAKSAPEAFVTSASSFVLPVVAIDEATLGNGRPGPVATRLRAAYLAGEGVDA